ncbi:hypothetical protein V1478_003681 [Vespula squamosa]|uniref:HNH endonuclease n=1 Tax=Vespula squamosa TaxID=30214 RepID=A0ABD2BNS8_VESSQ
MTFLVTTRFKLKACKERCGRKIHPFTSRLDHIKPKTGLESDGIKWMIILLNLFCIKFHQNNVKYQI